VRAQRGLLSGPVYSYHEPEPAGASGCHARQRVLEDGGRAGLGAQHAGSFEKRVRRGLAPQPARGRQLGVDPRFEQVRNPSRFEDGSGVRAGGYDRGAQPGCPYRRDIPG
jgi:hypothetical protein